MEKCELQAQISELKEEYRMAGQRKDRRFMSIELRSDLISF